MPSIAGDGVNNSGQRDVGRGRVVGRPKGPRRLTPDERAAISRERRRGEIDRGRPRRPLPRTRSDRWDEGEAEAIVDVGSNLGEAGAYYSGLPSASIQAIIDAAMSQKDVPYAWGGGGKNGKSRGYDQGYNYVGFDCSSLMQYAYHKAGIDIPRTSILQSKVGRAVTPEGAQPGDLIFWKRRNVNHIGMYLGNGKMIEAPRTGLKVRVSRVDLGSATTIRRIVSDTSGTVKRDNNSGGSEFARLVDAVLGQESGGEKNPVRAKGQPVRTRKGGWDHALGKYQIMGESLKEWAPIYLGQQVSEDEFLGSEALQDKLATARLRYYYDKFGAAGAAAAWYGGEGGAKKYLAGKNVNAQNGPKLRTYVSEVMARMKRSTATGGGRSGGTGGTWDGLAGAVSGVADAMEDWNNETTQAEKIKDMEAAFAAAGFSAALVNSDKELKDLFTRYVKEGWDDTRFQNEIKNSKWYRNRSDDQRAADSIRLNDPKTWSDNVHDQTEALRAAALAMGITISDARLKSIATASIRNSIKGPELNNMLVAEFNFNPKKVYKGESGDTINKIRDLAYSYGVTPTNDDIGKTTRSILRGENSIDGLRNSYIAQAKSRYGHFATEFDAGKTLEDIASPYVSQMAQTLELNPEDITLQDSLLQRGLARRDPKTNAASAMTLWEYEEALKNDERWMLTNNARDSMMSLGRNLLSSFGLAV